MKLQVYKPYKQQNFDYSIFINRLAPGKDNLIINFDSKDTEFIVKVFQEDKVINECKTTSKTAYIDKLPLNSFLSVQVFSKNNKSEVRKFHTGEYKHSLINYVDKEEKQYSYSGNFLGSPFITKFKNKLWVTMDIFKNGGIKNNGHIETMLFVSSDNGNSWDFVCDFVPAQWGRLFVLENTLYFIGSNLTENTTQIISSNDGYNWGESSLICKDGTTTPTSIAITKDYVVFTMRIILEGNNSHIIVARGDIKSGLLNSSSWVTSNVIVPDFSWGGDQTIHYAEEGNTIEHNGEIYVLLRFAFKKSLMLHYNVNDNVLKYFKTIDLECGWCKFFIEKYKDNYYAIGNHLCFPRQIVKLYKSKDFETWNEVKIIDDISCLDKDLNGIQYPSFFIEKNKIYLVLRIALNGSETFHNSNAIGFDVIDIKE